MDCPECSKSYTDSDGVVTHLTNSHNLSRIEARKQAINASQSSSADPETSSTVTDSTNTDSTALSFDSDREEMLHHLREKYEEVGGLPTGTGLKDIPGYDVDDYVDEFGSIYGAAVIAGKTEVDPDEYNHTADGSKQYSEWELINAIWRLYELTGKASARMMDNGGPYSLNTYQYRFGSWTEALERANIHGTFCFYDVDPQSEDFTEWETTFVELLSDWVGSELTRQRAAEQLKRQNERLDEFASVLSHDLRNPLNVAAGRLTLVREECESSHLDSIEQAHERMETLIEDLLALSRKGDTVTDLEPVDLTTMVEECWTTVETANATLVTDIDRRVQTDPARLKQLFENLIRNAVEHGGADVTITVGELDGGFYIEDDGPGIPESDRTEVFTAGFSSNTEGTGFGLSIVKRVVEAHNWDIRLSKATNGGTRFEITDVEFAAK